MAIKIPLCDDDKILLIAEQRGALTLWAEATVSDLAAIRMGADLGTVTQHYRVFVVLSTGEYVHPNCIHRGTALSAGGNLVWHIYEIS